MSEKKWEREADKYKDPNATAKDKLSNFWFYHKYHVLIAVVAVAAIIYMSTALLMKENFDYKIIFVTENPIITRSNGEYLDSSKADGHIYLYEEDKDYIVKSLESVGEDINGDGKVTVSLNTINVGTENMTASEIQKHREQILTALRTGDCMILLADKVGMEFLSEADALEDLSRYSDDLTYDKKAILFNKYFTEHIGRGDENTEIYIGLRYFTGTISQMTDGGKEDFAKAENLIKNILSK